MRGDMGAGGKCVTQEWGYIREEKKGVFTKVFNVQVESGCTDAFTAFKVRNCKGWKVRGVNMRIAYCHDDRPGIIELPLSSAAKGKGGNFDRGIIQFYIIFESSSKEKLPFESEYSPIFKKGGSLEIDLTYTHRL
jgi:hypothetical protein